MDTNKLIENGKKAGKYTGFVVLSALFLKKVLKINVLPDPTMKNVVELWGIMTGAVYGEDYLNK